jgi:hypothetical protein
MVRRANSVIAFLGVLPDVVTSLDLAAHLHVLNLEEHVMLPTHVN